MRNIPKEIIIFNMVRSTDLHPQKEISNLLYKKKSTQYRKKKTSHNSLIIKIGLHKC